MIVPSIPAFIRRELPAGMRSTHYDVGEQRMHVMEWGEGRPVLMQHGNPTWGFLYRKVVEELIGEPFRLIVPDLIGLGYSSRCRANEHTLRRHSAWLGALIDELDLVNLIFVGQDWGGPIGLHALSQRRERVAGMVILNTVVSPPRPGFKATAFHRFSRVPVVSDLAFRGLGFPQSALFAAQGDKRSIGLVETAAYLHPLRSLSLNEAPLALARMVPNSQSHPSIAPMQEVHDFATDFRGPLSVVWGTRDPVLGSVLRWIRKILPHAELTETRAGHFLQEEVPTDIAAAVRSVARRIDDA